MSETLSRPRVLEAEKSGRTLADKLGASIRDVTVPDAAAKTGLALRDAEKGLQWALSQYRGHIKVTEGGDLVFHFPTGFSRPWATRETLWELAGKLAKGLWAVLKVAMKVWILATILFYTAVFIAILLAITVAALARGGDDRDDDRGFSFGDYLMWRLVADLVGDAIWATFHYRAIRDYEEDRQAARTGRRREQKPKKRLYERVFQFIFGPERKEADPLEEERRVLSLIRERQGRVGLIDVMAVTGLDKDAGERLITRLLVDYEGEIEVTEEGAVFYIFKDLRKTVGEAQPAQRTLMSWERPVVVPPLTGDNGAGSNLTILALNTFNAVMSGFAIASDLTVANLSAILSGTPWQNLPDHSAAVFLGWVPFTFSVTVFAVPAVRAWARARQVARAQWENGKRALLQLVTRDPDTAHPPQRMAKAYENGAGTQPDEKALDQLLIRLGGDIHVTEDGKPRWRFPDLAREQKALSAARAVADDAEKRLGQVVYNSED
jgi:hypothetical protein